MDLEVVYLTVEILVIRRCRMIFINECASEDLHGWARNILDGRSYMLSDKV